MKGISKERLEELLAKARAIKAATKQQENTVASTALAPAIISEKDLVAEITSQTQTLLKPKFIWNEQQQQAIQLISSGKSCVIVGSAGTGKTSLVIEGLKLLNQKAGMKLITSEDATDCLIEGTAGIVVVSFTRTAVNNIANIIERAANCATIHKLIEFKPVFYEQFDAISGQMKNKRVFEPARNEANPLPESLTTIIVEECGMVNIRLFNQLLKAIPDSENVQFIFLGDLFQLDPPYDPAILGYAMNNLSVVELTQVYRQALTSPILRLAIDVKEGQTWASNHLASLNQTCPDINSSVTIKPWKRKVDSFTAIMEAAKFMKSEWESGKYNPERATIILPFGAAAASKDKDAVFGSLNLNRYIANFLGKARNAVIYEIIAGFQKHYLAVGDDVSYQKMRGKIVEIKRNYSFLGKVMPQNPSSHMDRWGHLTTEGQQEELMCLMEDSEEDKEKHIDAILAMANDADKEVFRNASHDIVIKLESGELLTINSAGDFNPQIFDFSYSQTCYKAQGGEWETVYIFTHKSHAVMLCNEFFYTAITRAKKHLVMIVEPDHLLIAVKRQSIPGKCWKEKRAHFIRPEKLEALKPFAELVNWLGN